MRTEQEETLPNLFIPKPDKDNKRKEITSIPHAYRCQHLEQNISKRSLIYHDQGFFQECEGFLTLEKSIN